MTGVAAMRVRLGAEIRHQGILLARDPGPMIGYVFMGLLLITVDRPLYTALGRRGLGFDPTGIDQACAGASVMFSLFAVKVAGAHLLNERTWRTWDRLRATPLRFGELLAAKSVPIYAVIATQQLVLFGFSAGAFGLHPRAGWWALAACGLAWAGCVLMLGVAASTLAASPAQLSAAGDIFAILISVLGGALVPVALLPAWLRALAPASPGYWAMAAYRAALGGRPGDLVHPLLMLGAFAVIGLLLAAAIGARQRADGWGM